MPRHSFLLLGLHQKSPCATMSRSALEGARRHIVRNLPCHGGGGGEGLGFRVLNPRIEIARSASFTVSDPLPVGACWRQHTLRLDE